MGVNVSPNKELEDLINKYNDRRLLWTHVDEFTKLKERWHVENIRELDSEEIQKDLQQYVMTVNKLKIRIQNLSKDGKDKVLDSHESRIRSVEALMPIISSVANLDLKDKHWKKIFDKLEQPFNAGKIITLDELLHYGIIDKKDAIE